MSDIELTSIRPSHPQQHQPRYQHLYSAGNGYWKENLQVRGTDELMGDDEDDGEDEEDTMPTPQPLEISTIARQHHSLTAPGGSSISSSYYSTNPLCVPGIVSQITRLPPSDVVDTLAKLPEEPLQSNSDHSPDVKVFEFPPPRPTRSQVLHYFARAQNFTLKRVEDKDMQITDQEGFPLFDAFIESDCCGRTWTIEAYGKLVLVMYEQVNSWCQDFARPRIQIRDWNGDYFGLLLPGETYYLHGSENRTVAKMVFHRAAGSGGVGILEDGLGFGDPSPSNAVVPAAPRRCWLCVMEGTGRHIARLEDYQRIQFNKDVAFQLKLLTLAGIVRLCGQAQLSPASNCVGTLKTLLNCCAGY